MANGQGIPTEAERLEFLRQALADEAAADFGDLAARFRAIEGRDER